VRYNLETVWDRMYSLLVSCIWHCQFSLHNW